MEEYRYTKDELKKSELFRKYADAIEALLDKDKTYTVLEAEEIIVNFMKGCV
ncbi:MAG: hypothetical protein ACI3XA_09910 [Clostridia bacterium]